MLVYVRLGNVPSCLADNLFLLGASQFREKAHNIGECLVAILILREIL